ncbi:3-oxoacyl-(acyl-carrier-protein) reductase FabG [Elizabethkingia miricola]|nr:3-oxoacyl-(acyl-carrier-protein) reductase FabG [Elizabethkingia miricola]
MKKRTFLVTGASRGIGLEISNILTEHGHDIVGIARNKTSCFPGELFPCDLTDIEKTEDVAELIKSKYSIDGIVNNAGIAIPQSLETLEFSSLQTVFDLNVRTSIQLTKFFIDGMKKRNYGRIMNICSRAIFGAVDRTAYSAAKSALVGCTRTWALEFAEYGITVNAIAPGPVETELFRLSHPQGSEAEEKVLKSIPMRRLGTARDIAAGVSFLMSEEASFITGQVLAIDGGGSLGGKS